MAEKSVFSGGVAGGGLKKLSEEDVSSGRDTYSGKYSDAAQTLSEQEKFGTNQNPVKNSPLPAKNLRGVGG